MGSSYDGGAAQLKQEGLSPKRAGGLVFLSKKWGEKYTLHIAVNAGRDGLTTLRNESAKTPKFEKSLVVTRPGSQKTLVISPPVFGIPYHRTKVFGCLLKNQEVQNKDGQNITSIAQSVAADKEKPVLLTCERQEHRNGQNLCQRAPVGALSLYCKKRVLQSDAIKLLFSAKRL